MRPYLHLMERYSERHCERHCERRSERHGERHGVFAPDGGVKRRRGILARSSIWTADQIVVVRCQELGLTFPASRQLGGCHTNESNGQELIDLR